MKKILISTLLVFIYIFFEQFVAHGIVLKPSYDLTSSLWRGEKDFLMEYMVISQILFSFFITVIFLTSFKNKGLKEGIGFGLLLGLLLASLEIGKYSYMPIPISLAIAWVVDSLILCIGSGVILSFSFGTKKNI